MKINSRNVIFALFTSASAFTKANNSTKPNYVDYPEKSTVEEIKKRFDNDVERFSNLETGQKTTIDARINMDIVVQSANKVNPDAKKILDVGCGAGNYAIRMLEENPEIESVSLIDLSMPMLERAGERIGESSDAEVNSIQGDIREVELPNDSHDIIIAAATLHHLRSDEEWYSVYKKLFDTLKPGGSLWVFDMVEHEGKGVSEIMWENYGEYLSDLKDDKFKNYVFDYIAKEDTPQSLTYQMNMMQKVGFENIDVLHKKSCFASFGGVKPLDENHQEACISKSLNRRR